MPFTDSIKIVDVILTNKTALTATPSDVAMGKQFIGTTQNIESGTLPVNPTRNDVTIVAGESYNIPNGINPVSYNVIAEKLENATVADADPGDLLDGKTAWVNGAKITGTMNNIGKEESTIAAGTSHQISRGFHDGSGVITAMSLFDQTKASVTAESLLTGSDCWANGEHIYGTMVSNKAETVTLPAGNSYTIPTGYHTGKGVIKAQTLSSQTSGNATAATLLAGRTAWVGGKQITGTMPNNSTTETILPINGTYTIPKGYHTGLDTVTQSIPTMDAQTIGPAKEIQTIPCAGYVMEGDITITGVDALNYQRLGTSPTDSTGVEIANYDLTVTNNTASVVLSVDNWHDNATLNVYNATFTDLIDSTGASVSLTCLLMLDWADQTTKIYTFGNVIITTSLQADTNAHLITIGGITSGKITLTEPFSAREFGTTETGGDDSGSTTVTYQAMDINSNTIYTGIFDPNKNEDFSKDTLDQYDADTLTDIMTDLFDGVNGTFTESFDYQTSGTSYDVTATFNVNAGLEHLMIAYPISGSYSIASIVDADGNNKLSEWHDSASAGFTVTDVDGNEIKLGLKYTDTSIDTTDYKVTFTFRFTV